jgi:hypothetical protein
MNEPLPKATPELAKRIWERQRSPSARSVARALSQSGHSVHFVTVARWRRRQWRGVEGQHPLDQARAALESALPLVTRDPASTIDDLVRSSPQRQELEGLSDGELLHRAAHELATAVYVVAHMMLRQEAEALVITKTGAVAVLVRALADAIRFATAAFGQALSMQSTKPTVAATDCEKPQPNTTS